MNALQKIKDIFGTAPSVHMSGLNDFLPVDSKAVKKELDISAKAAERGKRNEPPKTAEVFDDVERGITLFIDGERSRCLSQFNQGIATFDQRLAALRLEQQAGQVSQVVREATAEFKAQIAQGRDDLVLARDDVVEHRNYLSNFRRTNALARPARYPESHLFRWGLVAGLMIIESLANGYYFSKGNDFGLLGGVMQAVLVSAVNILSALIFSRTLLRWIWHRSIVWKAIGAIVLPLYLIAIVMLNLFVAHYRDALGNIAIDNPAQAAVTTFWSAPFVLVDFDSWILAVLGLLFATVSLLDGYGMDDPYPGYGDVDRAYRRRVTAYTDQKHELLEQLRSTRDRTTAAITDIRNELSKRRGEHVSILANRHRLLKNFRHHLDHLEAVGLDLLATYRSENKKHRSESVPSYFNTGWTLSRPSDPPTPQTLSSDALDALITGADTEARAAVEALHSAFEEAVVQYEKIEQLKSEATQ